MIAARQSFEQIIQSNHALGHENNGPLSVPYGFLPSSPPATALPASHAIWDELMAQLPQAWRNSSVRRMVDEHLPLLAADADQLADTHLLRASSLISILAHSYHRSEANPPDQMPDSIMLPWATIAARLGKHKPFLSYMDLIMYNWRLRDPQQPIVVENLDLLFPTVGNEEERIFYLTQVEIAARSAPIVSAVIRAQEAAAQGDDSALEREFLAMIEGFRYLAGTTIQKIDPNPHSSNFVNQVVWAKTVAPFAVPITHDTPGPSGTAAPIFHLMDAFFQRPSYDTVLGHESRSLSGISPRNWQTFIEAVREYDIVSYVNRHPSAALKGLFATLVDAFAGDKGFLGTHRLKAYGFLEIAFKVGRSVTIGGFTGLFKDKTWNQIDRELLLTREERYADLPHAIFSSTPAGGEMLGAGERDTVSFAHLHLGDAQFQYAPGDRVGILPENSDQLVQLTLDALQATGKETVKLNRQWRTALQFRAGYEQQDTLPLADFLRFGKLRPLTRSAAKQLHAVSASELLKRVINARAEDQWEIWDILNMLYVGGFDTRRLWKSDLWEAENICKIIPPETFRQYSIASAPNEENRLNLVVSGLTYETQQTQVSMAEQRYGTASQFIARLVQGAADQQQVALSLIPALRFHLPDDADTPIVMFAGGSGLAPFLGFLQERSKQASENWLFYGISTPDRLLAMSTFTRLAQADQLQLRVAFSQADTRLAFADGAFVQQAGKRGYVDSVMLEEAQALWDLLRPRHLGGKGAHLYVCGRSSFARTVEDALLKIFRKFGAGEKMLYQLAAEHRYHQDIFTTYTGTIQKAERTFDASELVLHNNPEQGYWMAISGRVYDVTSFAEMHPGGLRIIANNAGIDATRAYQSVLHDVNSEVDSLLGTVEIGVIRRLNFGNQWAVSIGPDGLFTYSLEDAFIAWVRYLYLITEMQNAVITDFSFRHFPTTQGEAAEEMTPLKLQLLIDSHRRIYDNFIGGLMGEDLDAIYRVTIGLCKQELHVLALRRILDEHQTSRDAGDAARVVQLMQTLHRTGQYQELEQVLTTVITEHKRFFEELKQVVRQGVLLFERYEAQIMTRSTDALIEILSTALDVLTRYHGRMALIVQRSNRLLDAPVEMKAELPYIGHGAASMQFSSKQASEQE